MKNESCCSRSWLSREWTKSVTVHSVKHSYRRSKCLLYTAAEIEREGPQVPVSACWDARMSQGFRLINVLAVWPVDVCKTTLFAGEGLQRSVPWVRGGHGDGTLPRAVGKIAKRDYSFVLSVCLDGITRLPLDRCSWNWIYGYFSKICRENSSFIKICQQ
jgi:hypothetical protein